MTTKAREHTTVKALRNTLNTHIQAIRDIPDAEQRAKAALHAADMLKLEYLKQVAAIRQEAVSTLYYDDGYKLKEIAEMLGIGISRAQQLTSGITPMMRKRWEKKTGTRL